jgi:hypothetical protein
MTHGERIARIKDFEAPKSANETNEQGNEKLMSTSKKSDGVLTAVAFRVKALPVRSNFWRNSVSNIAGVVEAEYTTQAK